MASVLRRNIEIMREEERRHHDEASPQDRLAQAITDFAGSMTFVYVHVVVFGAWILVNLGLVPALPRFDPTLVMLAMAASVEAIFLSTFVLISQNRMAAASRRRAELNLQIDLLAEHEITRLVAMTAAIAERIGVAPPERGELAELQRDVSPEAVLDVLDDETEADAR